MLLTHPSLVAIGAPEHRIGELQQPPTMTPQRSHHLDMLPTLVALILCRIEFTMPHTTSKCRPHSEVTLVPSCQRRWFLDERPRSPVS